MEEVIYSSEEEAFQHLSDITGKTIKVANGKYDELVGVDCAWGSPGYLMRGEIRGIKKKGRFWEVVFKDDGFLNLTDSQMEELLDKNEVSYIDESNENRLNGAHCRIELFRTN